MSEHPIASLSANAAKAAMEFEQSFANVRKAVDTSEGTADAVRLLVAAYAHVEFSPRLRSRLLHAIARLDRPLEAELFGESRTLVPDSEQAAMSMLRSTATDLRAAGSALDHAAELLKQLGKGWQASAMKQASQAAHAAAKGLVSE